jgi:hypothetical protein
LRIVSPGWLMIVATLLNLMQLTDADAGVA